MADDYTPSLEAVRTAWASMAATVRVSTRPTEEETAAEFDRMIEAVRAEEREKAAANLRWLADARAEYDHEATQREAHAARLLADIIDGQNDASGWLPSWRWDEWTARISEQRAGHLCPECKAGKHGNCDGTAWDDEADDLTTCTCTHEVGG